MLGDSPIQAAKAIAALLKKHFQEDWIPDGGNDTWIIRSGFMPRPSSSVQTSRDRDKKLPMICVRPAEINDPVDDDSSMKIIILVATYSADMTNGHEILYHALQLVRITLQKYIMVDGDMVLPGMKTTIPEEQTPPVWIGYVELTMQVDRAEPEIDFSRQKGRDMINGFF